MELTLEAKSRSEKGTAIARRMRREGKIPGVIYGRKSESQSLELDYVTFAKTFMEARQHRVLTLHVDGKPNRVLIRSIQQDPVTKKPSHVDFVQIDEDAALVADIPIRLKGTASGVRRGGILEFFLPSLRVKTLPKHLVEEIEVDISGLEVNDAVYVRDLKLPEDVRVISKDSQCLARVTPSRATKMAEAAERE